MDTVSPFTPASNCKLSQQDLWAISSEISRDFAPILAASGKHLSVQELRDISAEISRDFAPIPDSTQSELILMPVDPSHAYAYWNIANTPMPTAFEQLAGQPLILRLYAQSEREQIITGDEQWVDIPVINTQSYQPVELPPLQTATAETVYIGVIGKKDSANNLIPLINSNPLAYTNAIAGPDSYSSFSLYH